MPIKKVIALSGFKGSGKDTVADVIKNHIYMKNQEYCFTMSFAEPIRKIIDTMFFAFEEEKYCQYKLNKEENIEHLSKKFKKPITYRYLMNTIGQTMKNNFGDGLWTYYIEKYIHHLEQNCINNVTVIITDVRFKKELKLIKKLKEKYDVEHWLILRKTALPDWALQGLNVNNKIEKNIIIKDFKPSVSEFEWCSCNPKFNRMITNDGTIEELTKKIINIIE